MQFLSVHSQNDDDSYILENKCATFHPNRNTIIKDRKLAEITALNRPVLQKSLQSQSGKFLIHYDTTGFNAVSPIDENNNSISDYIDSVAYYLDYVFRKEV